jgi:hypothetical protein
MLRDSTVFRLEPPEVVQDSYQYVVASEFPSGALSLPQCAQGLRGCWIQRAALNFIGGPHMPVPQRHLQHARHQAVPQGLGRGRRRLERQVYVLGLLQRYRDVPRVGKAQRFLPVQTEFAVLAANEAGAAPAGLGSQGPRRRRASERRHARLNRRRPRAKCTIAGPAG